MKKILFSLIIVLINPTCYAFTLNGMVSGNTVSFTNAIQQDSDTYTLADWEPQSSLMPTEEWAPGFNNPGSILTLQGPGGTVSTNVIIKGMEYNTGGTSPLVSTPGFGLVPTCESDDFNGNIIHLENESSGECSTSYYLKNEKSVMPFYFLRPVIALSKSDISEAFDNLDNKVEGYYTGMITLPLRYWYKSIGDVTTYRNINHSFSMRLYYKPSELTEIRIISPVGGIADLKATLDPSGNSISATEDFQLEAKGLFLEGLVVELEKTNSYILTTDSDGEKYEIPFSLTCQSCDDKELVIKGEEMVDHTFIKSPNSTLINFSFRVHYDNVENESIRIGEYSGSFIIMFGADI